MTDIVVTERASDFHACVKDHPEFWGSGKTIGDAIGSVVMSNRKQFDINIEFPNK